MSALSGNSIYALCQFGMLSLLALLTTPAEVGRYALALAITGPVFIFANLKLRQAQVTDAGTMFNFSEYLAQRLTTSVIASAGIFVFLGVLDMPVMTERTIFAITLFKASESVIDISYGAMQREQQLQLVARSQMYRGMAGLLVFGTAVWAWERADIAATALVIATAAQIPFTLRLVARLRVPILPKFSYKRLKSLTLLTLPLGWAVAVSSMTINVPRYLIEFFVGTAQLGIFSALAYLLMVSGTIMASVGEAASPRLANQFRDGANRKFRKTLKRLIYLGMSIGLMGVCVAFFFGEPLLALLFGSEYAEYVSVLVVLMCGATVQNYTTFIGTAINSMRRFKIQLPVNLIILLIVSCSSVLFIQQFGIMGAALALLIGQVASAALYTLLLVRVVMPATSVVTSV